MAKNPDDVEKPQFVLTESLFLVHLLLLTASTFPVYCCCIQQGKFQQQHHRKKSFRQERQVAEGGEGRRCRSTQRTSV